MASSVLNRVGLRYLLRHRWQSLLMVVGIMLGVAVMVSIDLANASASRAFELSTEALTGKATHEISAGQSGLDETIYFDLVRSGRIADAAPVISDYVTSPVFGGQTMQLLGIDPLADAPFREFLGGENAEIDLEMLRTFFTRPGAILMTEAAAARYGLDVGDRLTLNVGGYSRETQVAGLLAPADALSQRALDGMLLADVATAQELTGRIGKIDRIDLILPPESAQELSAWLNDWLPKGVRLTTAGSRTQSVEEMTSAFRLNLTALSMLALVVGLFLIFNTMTFSVVQRRSLFGTLRCLGVTRREIFTLVLTEAAVVGFLGSLLGVGLGVLLGRNMVALVTRTINDLYFTTTVQAVGVPVESLIKGGLAGVLAAIATAALPALEAAAAAPRAALNRSVLESKAKRSLLWLALSGVLFLGMAALAFYIPGGGLLAGFGGTFLVMLGYALFSSVLLVGMMRMAAPVLGRIRGTIGRMAARGVVNSFSRTSVAVAALMIAVAVSVGVNLMIESFRYTVTVWLAETLQSDVYISAPLLNANRSSVVIDGQVESTVRTWPGIREVDSLRSIVLEGPQGGMLVSATENPHIGEERLFVERSIPVEQIWPALQAGSVLLAEPLANRLGLGVGDTVQLFSPRGVESFPVAGVFYDYSSSEGSLLMGMQVYRDLWKDTSVTALGLRLEPGVNADEVVRTLQDALQTGQALVIRANRTLREDVMEVFDRTFAITAALRILTMMVAFIGVLNALLLLQLEKQREIGVLRALGLTARQLWSLVMMETGLMGLAAGLLAAPLGYSLALVLIFVINRQSFGWTLQFDPSPGAFAQGVAVALGAALLAGVYPAWRLGRMMAADAIRME